MFISRRTGGRKALRKVPFKRTILLKFVHLREDKLPTRIVLPPLGGIEGAFDELERTNRPHPENIAQLFAYMKRTWTECF